MQIRYPSGFGHILGLYMACSIRPRRPKKHQNCIDINTKRRGKDSMIYLRHVFNSVRAGLSDAGVQRSLMAPLPAPDSNTFCSAPLVSSIPSARALGVLLRACGVLARTRPIDRRHLPFTSIYWPVCVHVKTGCWRDAEQFLRSVGWGRGGMALGCSAFISLFAVVI